jgi:hypothetical protein
MDSRASEKEYMILVLNALLNFMHLLCQWAGTEKHRYFKKLETVYYMCVKISTYWL